MANDATPDELIIVNHNFSTDNQKQAAQILQEQWDASSTFSDIAKVFEWSDSLFKKVYQRYMGVPESEFNDGIHDERTAGQLKDEYETYKKYREARKRGDVDPDGDARVSSGQGEWKYTEKHLEMWQDGYGTGHEDGHKRGWNAALEQIREVDIENVSPKDLDI